MGADERRDAQVSSTVPAPDDASEEWLRQLAGTPGGVSEAEAIVERQKALQPGALIAKRYRLERLLGEGGMGTVWAAVHTVTSTRVALKFLKAPGKRDSEARRRFTREARAASAVKHPNVVEIVDVLELDDGTPVIVMDLLEGETLRARLEREHRLSLETTAALILPVARAMEAAHRAGIVHRDLKPDNVFLAEGRPAGAAVKVLDFGVAKLLAVASTESDLETRTGALVGTPAYMALEQALGQTDLDHRVDVWALGTVLYECLAGERAVKGSNVGRAVLELTSSGVRPIAEIGPDLPADLRGMLERMLAVHREARLDDLGEVVALLARYAHESPERGDDIAKRRSPRLVRRPVLLWSVLAGLAMAAALLALSRQGVTPLPSQPVSNRHAVTVAGPLLPPDQQEPKAIAGPARAAPVSAQPPSPPESALKRPAPSGDAVSRRRSIRTDPPPAMSTVTPAIPEAKPVPAAATGSARRPTSFEGGLIEQAPF